MFDTGDKVIVVGSTVKKNRIGPKKGSIGYVLNKHPVCSMYSDDHQGMKQVFKVSVLFVRYGFEKKHRFEIRTVLSTVSGVPGGTDEKEFIKMMSLDLNNKNGTKTMMERLRGERLPTCTLVPADVCFNTMAYNNHELIGWIIPWLSYSTILSDVFFEGPYTNELINKNVISELLSIKNKNLSVNVSNITEWLSTMINPETKREVIDTLTLAKNITLDTDAKNSVKYKSVHMQRLYEDGMPLDDILIELDVYLLGITYTNRYAYIEANILDCVHRYHGMYYGTNDRSRYGDRYGDVSRRINNTRNVARSLGCLFSRSLDNRNVKEKRDD